MKHLYLFNESKCNAAIFGVGTYVQTLVLCLQNSGVKMTIVQLFSDLDEVKIDYKNFVRIIYIPCLTPRFSRRTYYYKSVFFIISPLISDSEENIFHYNYLSCCFLAKEIKNHFPLSKNILTIHYREFSTSENPDSEKEFINNYSDKIIVLGKHASNSLQKDFNTPEEKIRIISNGIIDDYKKPLLNRDAIKQHFGININDKIVLYVGRFDGNKNPCLLLKSFQKLFNTKKNCHLILAGDGDFSSLYSVIDQFWGKITVTGFLEKNKLKQLYQIADIGVIPSKYEEFGYVAIEMMMHGVPIIANRTSGLSELIVDKETGILLDLYTSKNELEDITLLFMTIDSLLENEKERNKYAMNARNRYLKSYMIELYKSKMISIYNEQ